MAGEVVAAGGAGAGEAEADSPSLAAYASQPFTQWFAAFEDGPPGALFSSFVAAVALVDHFA